MKRYGDIDYDFRPESYWSADDPLALILRHVKGSNRRQLIRDYWNAGALKELDDQLLKDTLTDAERKRLGRIHPSFMGGEYLPEFKIGEEEIVRVQLASITSDAISVRARPVSGGIAWRAVDEYQESGEYVLTPALSGGPLSVAELIGMLETATYTDWDLEGGLLLGWNNYNLEGSGSAEELRGFTTIESRFYPGLGPHCERAFDDWVVERDGAAADDENWAEEDEPGDGSEGDDEEDAA